MQQWLAHIDGHLTLHGTWSPFAPGAEWNGGDLTKLIGESGLPFTHVERGMWEPK